MKKWISVNDRLPEIEDDSVLVYFSHGGIDMVYIHDYFDSITCGVDGFGKQLYTKYYISIGITHWMPLPSPPE